jgi:hypothetical protein
MVLAQLYLSPHPSARQPIIGVCSLSWNEEMRLGFTEHVFVMCDKQGSKSNSSKPAWSIFETPIFFDPTPLPPCASFHFFVSDCCTKQERDVSYVTKVTQVRQRVVRLRIG